MIRFHYMARTDNLTPEGLSKLSEEIDSYNYYSMLLTYDPMVPDNLIKIANIINKKHKFKYMPAIRTYAMSPEYFGMVCRAFDQIQNNRLMVNIVSGDINKNETYLQDVVGISSFIKFPEQRLAYTEEWLEKFLSLKFMDNYPEIIMSGHSDKTIQIAKDNKITHLVSWFNYKDDGERERYLNDHKTMVSFAAVIRDSVEEAELFFNTLSDKNAKNWTVYGTEQDFVDNVTFLQNCGIEDIQISTFAEDSEKQRIHKIVKEMGEKING